MSDKIDEGTVPELASISHIIQIRMNKYGMRLEYLFKLRKCDRISIMDWK